METVCINVKEKIIVHTVGVHTSRYNTFEIINKNIVVFVCGVYLHKYDIQKKQSIGRIKMSDSAIFCMSRNFYHLVVASHNGDVCVVDIDLFKVVSKFKIKNGEKITDICSSDDMRFICACSDYYVDTNNSLVKGALFIYERKEEDDTVTYHEKQAIQSTESFCMFTDIDKKDKQSLIVLERIIINEFSYYVAKEYSIGEEVKLNREIIIDEDISNDEILQIKKYNNLLCLNYGRRIMKIFDTQAFKVIIKLKFEGAGCMGCFDFKAEKLFVSNFYESLLSINLQHILSHYQHIEDCVLITIKKDSSILQEEFRDLIQIVKIVENNQFIVQLNFFMNISDDLRFLFWGNELGLFIIDLISKEYIIKLESFIKSSGCGITINEKEKLIAVGDLEQNITVFNSFWDDLDTCPHFQEGEIILSKFYADDPIRTE
jgi:hypothetical protein